MGPQRDAVWRETGVIEKFPENGLVIRWRTPIGAGYAGPAVAGGRVFVHDRTLAQGAANPDNPFSRGGIAGKERVLCLNEKDGTILWTHEYDAFYTVSYPAGPRATPAVEAGKVYALGAEGHLVCLNADDGKVVWSHELTADYNVKTPIWGFAGHPLIEGKALICLVGGSGSVVVAFDKDTGQELWRSLSAKEPGYSPPTMLTLGGRRQLIVWHPEAVSGLDPKTGQVLWSHPSPIRQGMSIAAPRSLEGDRLYLSSFYNGSLMLHVSGEQPQVLWQSQKASEKETDALHAVMATPFIESGHIYGSCSYGQFRCLTADTGQRVWETQQPTTEKLERWGTAFVVKHADRFFLFNERGQLLLAKLTPQGYQEISRAPLIEPDNRHPGRPVVWSHPAFANRCIYARNDSQLVCASLAAE